MNNQKLIAELLKFPSDAQVHIMDNRTLSVGLNGTVDCPSAGARRRKTKGALPRKEGPIYKMCYWLEEHPYAAQLIAFAAVNGLYFDHDASILPESESNPRGSGSDYVDEVGSMVDAVGLLPVIRKLQEDA